MLRTVLPVGFVAGLTLLAACASTTPATPPGATGDSALLLPPQWTVCETDADCTFASLGCCDPTPVSRKDLREAQRLLDDSGRPFCAPKEACGPGGSPSWAGAPGTCRAKICTMPGS